MRKQIDVFRGLKRKETIFDLIKVYGLRCWYCGLRFEYETSPEICIDHIIPLANKGSSKFENLALACKCCNSHKFYHLTTHFLKYLSRIRSGQFECLILDRFKDELENVELDRLKKSFY